MFVDLVNSEDVLKAVQARGPIIPMEIRKFLGKGDSITIGAALSTLSSKGQVKFTTVKIGGSPFYYVKGQENRLELLNKYLNDKDKRTFEELRQSKVLKDSSQEPLIRVSLRNIPDFAKKLELTNNGDNILYWRWYLVNEDDAIDMIRGNYRRTDISEQQQAHQSQQSQAQNEDSIDVGQINSSQQLAHSSQHNQSSQSAQGSQHQSSQSNVQQPFNSSQHNQSQPNVQQARHESNSNNQVQSKSDDFIFEKDKKEKESVEVKSRPVKPKREVQEKQQTISPDVPDFDDPFFKEIKKFFNKNDISLKDAKLIRKGSEYEFVVSLKTPFGETDYFCKAKSKKKCNEGDLSSAYLQGQNKRLPTVFITTGEITKKAKQIASDEYKGLLIKEL